MEDSNIVDIVRKRMENCWVPDSNGEIRIEYGDFPVYGDGRLNHKFVARVEIVRVKGQ